MPINPLQLPGPLVVPQIDFTPLVQIGRSIGEERRRQALGESFSGLIGAIPESGAPTQQPQPTPQQHDALDTIAVQHGFDPRMFKRWAQLETTLNPTAEKGRFKGLFQLDEEDFKKRGGQDIFNPLENAQVAAAKFAENREALRRRFGREPTAAELYLSHQQGLGGLSAHMSAPNRAAWQSMRATGEGKNIAEGRQLYRGQSGPQAADQWAQDAIWGNVPDALKQQFGSVDNVKSGDFLKLWQMKVDSGNAVLAPPSEATASGIPPEMKRRLQGMVATGDPSAIQAAMMLAQKYMEKPELKVIPAGGVLVNQAGREIARGQPRVAAPAKAESYEEMVAERKRQAVNMGMNPADPQTRAFLLTGKLPGEDKLITATDKKAILDADDKVIAHDNAIETLTQAKTLSPKAWGFKGSGPAAMLTAPISKSARDTVLLNNMITAQAVTQLRAIFGGMPTEGERAVLLEIQGSSTMPDEVRQKVYDRAIKYVERRKTLAQQQADQIRGGTYFRPGGGLSGVAPAIPEGAVRDLKGNPSPERREQFDRIFGEGAAARVLGAR